MSLGEISVLQELSTAKGHTAEARSKARNVSDGTDVVDGFRGWISWELKKNGS